LHLMAMTSRAFGGLRTSDLHAWDWGHFPDLTTWRTAKVYRPKTQGEGVPVTTRELTEMEIPADLRDMLYPYWVRLGRPTSGPVFPALRDGKKRKKGQRQGKRSHARELRLYLWRAGVHTPLPGFDEAMATLESATTALAEARAAKAKGTIRELQWARAAAEQSAQALDVLQAGSDDYQCAEFHSFRRINATAVAASGATMSELKALGGWEDTRTADKYVKLAQQRVLKIPAASLPDLGSSAALLKPGRPKPPPLSH
jgi:hypothetical protein